MSSNDPSRRVFLRGCSAAGAMAAGLAAGVTSPRGAWGKDVAAGPAKPPAATPAGASPSAAPPSAAPPSAAPASGAEESSAPASTGSPASTTSRPAGTFIDVHTHLGQTWNHSKPLTAKGLLEWMDARGVVQAVVLPLVSPESSSFPLTTDFVLEQTRPHRDRLIPFCAVDPRTSYSGGRHGLKHMLQSYIDQGAKGFGEHKPGLAIDDPRSQEIYAVCGELGLPLLFHLDDQRNTDAPGLPRLEKMLKTFPKTTFIGHGPGWWASIGGETTAAQLGGYPKGKVPAGGAMDRLMEAYPNIYSDLSAGSGAGAFGRDLDFAKGFVARRADRLMFGSDYLAPEQKVPQFDVFAKIEMPHETRSMIYHDNARRILRLG